MSISGINTAYSSPMLWNDREESQIAAELQRYGEQDSILSEIIKMRVSQFDVLILFFEILKLDIQSRENETIARRDEQEAQLRYMREQVEVYRSQASSIRYSGLTAGLAMIGAGSMTFVNHVAGFWVHQKVSGVITSLQSMNKDEMFKMAATLLNSTADMAKMSGDAQKAFYEADSVYARGMSELHSHNRDEKTRSIQELKEDWQQIERFVHQVLQMNHDATSQLYR